MQRRINPRDPERAYQLYWEIVEVAHDHKYAPRDEVQLLTHERDRRALDLWRANPHLPLPAPPDTRAERERESRQRRLISAAAQLDPRAFRTAEAAENLVGHDDPSPWNQRQCQEVRHG